MILFKFSYSNLNYTSYEKGAKITGGGAGGTVAILGLTSAKETFETCVVIAYAKKAGLSENPYVFVGSSLGADKFGVRELLKEVSV